ncbi:MAG: NrfD/PsrC family molybdoenzyme membrane anchor subunit [Halovenus sp.]
MSQSTERTGFLPDGDVRVYSWIAVVALGILVGLYGVVRLLTEGTVVLGITDQVPWGILISTYEFFLLMSAGVMVGVVALSLVFDLERFDVVLKRAALVALATLSAGLFTILVSLGQPLRPFVHALVNANLSSPMWWVICFAGVFGAVLLALVVVLHRDVGSDTLTRGLGIAGLFAGLGVAVAAGMIFGTAEIRSYYGGPLAPVYFVLTGLLTGVAAIAVATVGEVKLTSSEPSDDLRELLTGTVAPLLGLLLGATLLLALVKAAYGLTATSNSTALAYEQMLLGSFGPVYWIVGILLGLLVPLGLLAIPATRTADGVFAASVFALLGVFVMRYEFVVGGQVAALVSDGGNQYPVASYAPSGTELAVVVFAFALCALVYTAGSWLLNVESAETGRMRTTPTTAGTGGDDDD